MTTYELDPDGLHDTARDLEAELAGLESPRAALSAAIDAAAGAAEDARIVGELINVWNYIFAPQVEGGEQRIAALAAGLRNVGTEYDDGDERMVRAAVDGLDDAPTVEITDAKEV